ncbi:hypothetical protein F2P79_016706 [Pimephales promelas]|nr:hypothetical protein F2P79_016706 [Pimephales promelas]
MCFNTMYFMLMWVRMAPRLPLIFLLMIHGVSSADWGVSYNPTHICALNDSTVIMRCTYTYPTGHQIKKVFWTKTKDKEKHEEFPDLSEDPEYSQRLQYLGDKQQDCTVRLSHVTLKDSHMYYFRFITDKVDKKWIGKSGMSLTVTDLQVESPDNVTEGDSVNPPRNVSVLINGSGEIVEGDSVTLKCISDSNPSALNFSWFKENESSAVGSGQSFSALQSGRFYCQAHNQHGSQRSDAVTVTGEAFINTLLYLHIIHQFGELFMMIFLFQFITLLVGM